MAKKTDLKSKISLIHRMSSDEKKLFRILFEYALPHLATKKEHTINPECLLRAWNSDASLAELEHAFWNLGVTLTYECIANPLRSSWGSFALFDGWGIQEDGLYRYAYNSEFTRLLSYPNVYKQLLAEHLILPESEIVPSLSFGQSVSAPISF